MGATEIKYWSLHYHVYVKLVNNKPVDNCDPQAINYFTIYIKNNSPF